MAVFQQTLEKLQHFPLHPVATESTTFTGATTNIADLKDFDGDIQIILDSGAAAASGTMTGKIQDSADGSTGWADVTGGGFTAAAANTAGFATLILNSDILRRYVRVLFTVTGGTGTGAASVMGRGSAKYL